MFHVKYILMINRCEYPDRPEKVCLVGSGYLGTQIGILCARYGYKVNMYDVSQKALETSFKDMKSYLDEWFEKKECTRQNIDEILNRVSLKLNMADAVSEANIIIEAVVEVLNIKREVFKNISKLCSPNALITTNSSSIRVSRIEDVCINPERAINMHFYSFPWRSRILELMKGTYTTDRSLARAETFSRSINVTPLVVKRESTGFIFNRVWRAIKKECLKVVNEGVASYEDVDRAWMSLYGMDVGPFELMDRVGLDVVRDIENIYYGETGDPKDAPPEVLLERIERGELGVKTGKGFYSYPNPIYLDPGWLHPDDDDSIGE
jgi:3-hydroxybutyryl-CoA dehydrogenase